MVQCSLNFYLISLKKILLVFTFLFVFQHTNIRGLVLTHKTTTLSEGRLALLRRAVAPLVGGDLRLDALDVHAAAAIGRLAARTALSLEAHDCW